MCSPKSWCVLLSLLCIAPGSLVFAQSANQADNSTASISTAQVTTEDQLRELRREVAELQAQLQQLLQANGAAANAAAPPAAAAPATATHADVDALQNEISALQKKASEVPPATAGWNGEHFILRSTDGNFTLMPVGYLDGQYAVYDNSYGAPPDSFAITRARFGFQGNYGKQLDYVFMVETISSPTIRDAYLDFKPWSFFNIMAGQAKVPFSLEVGTADTAVDFYNHALSGRRGRLPRSRPRCSWSAHWQ